MWEENQKIIDIVDEKTFQPGLRTGKEKPRLVERGGVCSRKDLFEGGTWMIRDLDDKGLGQNKVLFSIQRSRTAKDELPMQAPRRSLRQGDRSPATEIELQWSNCQCRLPDTPCARKTDLRPSAGFWPF